MPIGDKDPGITSFNFFNHSESQPAQAHGTSANPIRFYIDPATGATKSYQSDLPAQTQMVGNALTFYVTQPPELVRVLTEMSNILANAICHQSELTRSLVESVRQINSTLVGTRNSAEATRAEIDLLRTERDELKGRLLRLEQRLEDYMSPEYFEPRKV